MSRFAVAGGGISGLLAAYRLQQDGHEVVVFEPAASPGGKITGGEIAGIAIDDGPDAFLPRDPAPLELLAELGLDELVSPAVFGAYIWHRGALRRLPEGSPYGIPRHPGEARRAGLLSIFGAARANLERFRRTPLRGPDLSLGEFVKARFGTEVLDAMVDPLLAGVRGGSPMKMSLAAAAREIDSVARNNASVLRALRATPPAAPRFVRPAGGMTTVIGALAARAGEVRTSTSVERIQPATGGMAVASASGTERFDGIVLACPPFAAAGIVRDADPTLAELLESIGYASLAVVTLVYPPGSFAPPSDGSGFLAPASSGLVLSACTWYSHKWPGVTSDRRQVVRGVIGRAGSDPNLTRPDEELAALAHRDLVTTMGVSHEPEASRVVRWDRAIPQYRVGHHELVAAIERRASGLGPVVVTGAGYRGSGIPDCIAQAQAAARSLTEPAGSVGG